MGVITEREKQKYFAYLDGASDGLKEANKMVVEVLQKIRAEIQTNINDCSEQIDYGNTDVYGNYSAYCEILHIIDKHIKEYENAE